MPRLRKDRRRGCKMFDALKGQVITAVPVCAQGLNRRAVQR